MNPGMLRGLGLLTLLGIAAGCAGSPAQTARPKPSIARAAFQAGLESVSNNPEGLDQALNQQIARFRGLVETGRTFREGMVPLAQRLHAKIKAGQPLDGSDHDALQGAIQLGMENARQMFEVVDANRFWFRDRPFSGTVQPPIELRTKGALLSLASSLFLYDSYRLFAATLASDATIRKAINRGDSGYGNEQGLMESITREYLSLGIRMRVRDEYEFVMRNSLAAFGRYADDPDFRFLVDVINQCDSKKRIADPTFFQSGKEVMAQGGASSTLVRDDLHRLADHSANTVSAIFGNSVGLVETRKGRLFGNPALTAAVADQLKPGDILLEKTPFRLTDTFIPGHWGHVAIWLGTESELRRLGLWDDPLVQPHQSRIRQGQSIVEALRSGVTLNPLSHFLNVDDLAVLRDPAASHPQTTDRLRKAFRQIGKRYDFNFDVQTTDKIVCSELAYVVYDDLPWPTGKALGRHTISPDQVASCALPGGPLQLVLLYHDGQKIVDTPQTFMAELMKRVDSGPRADGVSTPHSASPQDRP